VRGCLHVTWPQTRAAAWGRAASTLAPAKQLFFGHLPGTLFPFPCALSESDLAITNEMAEPVGKFFEEAVDSARIDWDHSIPEDVMQNLREMGLWGLQIPTEFGGLGLSNTAYARIVEELVSDPSVAVMLMAHQSIGLKGILLDGTEEQKARYLPKLASGEHIAAFCLTEPGAGSDAAGIKTRAVPADDGSGDWILNGGKSESSHLRALDDATCMACSVDLQRRDCGRLHGVRSDPPG
jgi:acyl-CoA dehydrogenase family member 9